ncbi:MAG: hypothetical protein KatS3mg118_0795 [Paracoccaceae bacterium]|nr:MAG: hypothetical protein KatS3mg118_0795 [Paracoccaceae bacterium]
MQAKFVSPGGWLADWLAPLPASPALPAAAILLALAISVILAGTTTRP